MIDPKYLPEEPPGMVFFSNFSKKDTDEYIIERMTKVYNIPKEDFQITKQLENQETVWVEKETIRFIRSKYE